MKAKRKFRKVLSYQIISADTKSKKAQRRERVSRLSFFVSKRVDCP